jgi:hypothetical protein
MDPGKPVEPASLVRAVLGTKAGTNTTIINLVVDPFPAVIGSKDRADRFAGGFVTVLAQHGQEAYPGAFPGLRFLGLKISFDVQPGHLSSPKDLILSHDGHVVFGITSHHTGPAADAAIQVYHHDPPVVNMLVGLVKVIPSGKSFG